MKETRAAGAGGGSSMANPDDRDGADSDDDERCEQAAQGAAARLATQDDQDSRQTYAQLRTALQAAMTAHDTAKVEWLKFALEEKRVEEGVAREERRIKEEVARQEKWRAEEVKGRQEDRERLIRMEDMMLASAGGRGAGRLSFSRGGGSGRPLVALSPGSDRSRQVSSDIVAAKGDNGNLKELVVEATSEFRRCVLRSFLHMGPFGVDAVPDGINAVASSLKSAEEARKLKGGTPYPQVGPP